MEMKYLLKNDALQGKEDPLSLFLLFIEFHSMHFVRAIVILKSMQNVILFGECANIIA